MTRLVARLVAVALSIAVVARVPAWFCARRADSFFDGELEAERALARGARLWLEREPETLALGTGSTRFDGEWFLIVHMAAALGFGQTARAHPELYAPHRRLVERAIDRLLTERGRRHDVEAWGEDPLDSLDGPHGHLAYLGYANLALSMHRRIDSSSRFGTLNERITEALARRFGEHGALLESYPGETYPADNAAAVASIALFDRASGASPRPVVAAVLRSMRGVTDRDTGLLYQRVDSDSGVPVDGPRASGTAMAAFALGTAGRQLARPWWKALARQCDTVLGFGGVREYGPEGGSGDVDSGPTPFGMSVSASGFALASARRFGDRRLFRSLFASAWLLGLPAEDSRSLRFVAGGPLGDALLFALLTARDEP